MSSFDFSHHAREYQQYQRRLGDQISMQMLDAMSDNEMLMAAKKLHMVHKNTLMFDRETESDILAEFALFSHLHAFGSIALRWCSRNTPTNMMDESIFAGVRASFYSIFRVMELFPGKGVLLQDMFTKKEMSFQATIIRTAIANGCFENMGF